MRQFEIGKLEELRTIHAYMNSEIFNEDEETYGNKQMIWEAMDKVIRLNNLARLEGVLSLEEVVLPIALDSEEEILRQLTLLMLDGTDSEIIAEIGMSRYYTSQLQSYRALRWLMYVEGVLSIQAGENPGLLEEKLKSMLPRKMYLEYSKK